MDHRVRIGRADLRSLGRAISRAIPGDRSLVSTRSKMDRLGDHDLRVGGVDPPSLDAAHAARLLEHVFETGNGRGPRACRGFAASNVVDAVDLALCRWKWTGIRRAGVSLCFYHDRLRRGLRFSFAHRFGHDAKDARAGVAHSRDRLWRDDHGDDGGIDGHDRSMCFATGRIFRDQRERSPE